MTQEPDNHEKLSEAVKTRQERRELWAREGERSLGQNLAMIGVLGWTIVSAYAAGAVRWPLARPHFPYGDFLDVGPARSWPCGRVRSGLEEDAQRMTGVPSPSMPELAVAMGIAGFIFGLFYFAAVQRTAALLAARKNWLGPLALTLGRMAAAAIFLALAAKLGAASLLSAFLGFLLARAVALRNAGRTG